MRDIVRSCKKRRLIYPIFVVEKDDVKKEIKSFIARCIPNQFEFT